MKQTVKEARLARGWTQQQLAEKAQVSVGLIARIEQGSGGATFDQAQLLATALGISVHMLKVPESRKPGRPAREGRELLESFYLPGRYDPTEGRPAALTLPAARRAYSSVMCALDQRMRPEWERFLQAAPSDSALETVHWLLELQRGARFCEVSPQEVGFDRFPVVDRNGSRIVGHCRVPALVTNDWLAILQVTMLTPARYRVDGLVAALRPRRVFIDLEIDGGGHDGRFDKQRTRDLGLGVVRLSEQDVLTGVGLTERLRGLELALPKKAG